MTFSKNLRNWYFKNSRNLPWRNTTDPYQIWLSEIMLQQTRVDQATAYYYKFIENFESITDLANADEQELLKLWQGLGYYSRARNLHHAAQQIRDEYNGKFPEDYKTIRKLKGVGDYTAAAIASFAFNLPYAVLDGNVFRVLSRINNDPTPIDTCTGKKLFQAYADALLPINDPAQYNQAIMELGALICTPKKPDCPTCPVQEYCKAYRAGTQLELPVKSKKIKIKERYFHYFIPSNSQTIYFSKRSAKDIWQNMFELPMHETEQDANMSDQKPNLPFLKKQTPIELVFQTKHILTHQRIIAKFYTAHFIDEMANKQFIIIENKDYSNHPVPVLIAHFLEQYLG
ncbi:MAG: A/G-specific adenine glycosylase [Crocinitomicaceae bacterium]|nr:A/G-specific adenine glycosylase [Crocinitomicaceae bacterium]